VLQCVLQCDAACIALCVAVCAAVRVAVCAVGCLCRKVVKYVPAVVEVSLRVRHREHVHESGSGLHRVAVGCSGLSVLQSVATCCTVLQHVAATLNVSLQVCRHRKRISVCCSGLQ